jgi:hypothetical protein
MNNGVIFKELLQREAVVFSSGDRDAINKSVYKQWSRPVGCD